LRAHVFGALDLYGTRPVPPSDLDLDAAAAVAAEMARFLTGDLSRLGGTVDDDLDGWLDLPPAAERLEVWTAVGMVRSEFQEGDSAVLDRFGGSALGPVLRFDQLARNVLERLVPLTDLHH
jgi:hypothetical protein